MPLTPAEKMKRYRDLKLKQNPDKLEEIRKKNLENYLITNYLIIN